MAADLGQMLLCSSSSGRAFVLPSCNNWPFAVLRLTQSHARPSYGNGVLAQVKPSNAWKSCAISLAISLGLAIRLAARGARSQNNSHRRASVIRRVLGTTAAESDVDIIPTIACEALGIDLQVLALKRTADGDILVVRKCEENGVASQSVCLHRTTPSHWEDAHGDIAIEMDDAEMASSLLGRDFHDYAAAAPNWPSSVTDGLRPWPLKGIGTILFDANCLGSTAVQMIGGGEGPVLVPNAAEKLSFPTTSAIRSLQSRLGTSLQMAFCNEVVSSSTTLSYGDLLQSCPEVGTGGLDLSRVPGIRGGRRQACLASKPFGFEAVPRKWTQGAVLRAVGRGSAAEEAGCRAGDLVISVNGQDALSAPWEEVASLLEAEPPLRLELAQPILADPLYLREASPNLLRSLAGFRSAKAVKELFPRVCDVFADAMPLTEKEPLLFAGDGGSASHVHVDSNPQVQMCHVLHGMKLFGVAEGEVAASVDWVSRWGAGEQAEVSLPVDRELPASQAAWLAGDGVSVAAGMAGDALLFWGGSPHFGANATGVGPCVALFHACEARSQSE